MSDSQALHGLSCPRCGGMVPIPEGQAIVTCPYCDLRSIVKGKPGERGVRRYQVPQRVQREQAVKAYQGFLHSSMAIGSTVARQAKVDEVMLVHLPFWTAWGRALAWVFGQKEVGSGDNRHYEAREVHVAEDMTWNNAACDVGEFGVRTVNLSGRPLEPFDAAALHHSGMVFEPVGSAEQSLEAAKQTFEDNVRAKSKLDKIAQTFVRIVRPHLGLVYYPLWVVRYLFRGRSFQVVVDGYTGEVLYGKAPGNVFFRALVLVGGMMGGSILAVTVAGSILVNSNSNNALGGAAIAFVAGIALMLLGWRRYRYGEHYEYLRYKEKSDFALNLPGSAGEIIEIVRSLEKEL